MDELDKLDQIIRALITIHLRSDTSTEDIRVFHDTRLCTQGRVQKKPPVLTEPMTSGSLL